MSEIDYNENFRERTKRLALDIINELTQIKYSVESSVIKKQIIRSATSVAANYRAVCRARSNKERYAKICIVVEEIDETVFWLELLNDLKLLPIEKINKLQEEAEEILRATSSYKNKLSKSYNAKKLHHPSLITHHLSLITYHPSPITHKLLTK